MKSASLHIGYLLPADEHLPLWQHETLRLLREAGHRIRFLHGDFMPPPRKLRFYQLLERAWFGRQWDAIREDHVPHTSSEILPVEGRRCWYPDNATRTRLEESGLDLIYVADAEPPADEALSRCSRFGLAFLRLGTNNRRPAGQDEVLAGEPVASYALWVKKDREQHCFFSGRTNTVPYSVYNTQNVLYWKAASALPFALSRIRSGQYSDPLPGSVKTGSVLPGLLRNALRYLRSKSKRTVRPFTLLLGEGATDPLSLSRATFRKLDVAGGSFYADPFLVEAEDRRFLFLEHYLESEGRAHIAVMDWDRRAEPSPPRPVLREPHHLSYPFVFRHEAHWYLLPESAGNKSLLLYRALAFPDRWEAVTDLAEGRELIDATLHHREGKWWLFANSRTHPLAATNDQLFLFYRDDLFSGTWTPHPQNPVATDAGNCRPAGRIFYHEGKWYRPAQDNAAFDYGHGLVINEILTWNEEEYREQEARRYAPGDFGLQGLHHVDFGKTGVLIDGR